MNCCVVCGCGIGPGSLCAKCEKLGANKSAPSVERETPWSIDLIHAPMSMYGVFDVKGRQLQAFHKDAKLFWERIVAAVNAEGDAAKWKAAGNEMSRELHAAINEPEYAGTRADWQHRAFAAEAREANAVQARSPFEIALREMNKLYDDVKPSEDAGEMRRQIALSKSTASPPS